MLRERICRPVACVWNLCHDERRIATYVMWHIKFFLKMVNMVPSFRNPFASPEPQNTKAQMVLSYLALRVFVGVIGVLLPWVLLIGNWAIGDGTQPSMSGYYYTPMRNIFVGALCALAVFLVAYQGYDLADTTITNLAGVGTVGTALCPTAPYGGTGREVVIGDCHLVFAVITFLMLAVMALRFAKREPTPAGLSFWRQAGYAFGFTGAASSVRPLWKTVLYRVCGFVILLALALIYPGSLVWGYSLLALEMIMLIAFGLSWFVKGSTLLAGG
jgi:hypothetical protein